MRDATRIGLNGKKTVNRTTDPGKATCWNCGETMPNECFSPSALRNNGECKPCRKKSNARYWTKYKSDLAAFESGAS